MPDFVPLISKNYWEARDALWPRQEMGEFKPWHRPSIWKPIDDEIRVLQSNKTGPKLLDKAKLKQFTMMAEGVALFEGELRYEPCPYREIRGHWIPFGLEVASTVERESNERHDVGAKHINTIVDDLHTLLRILERVQRNAPLYLPTRRSKTIPICIDMFEFLELNERKGSLAEALNSFKQSGSFAQTLLKRLSFHELEKAPRQQLPRRAYRLRRCYGLRLAKMDRIRSDFCKALRRLRPRELCEHLRRGKVVGAHGSNGLRTKCASVEGSRCRPRFGATTRSLAEDISRGT